MTFLGPLDRFDGMIPKRPRRRAITTTPATVSVVRSGSTSAGPTSLVMFRASSMNSDRRGVRSANTAPITLSDTLIGWDPNTAAAPAVSTTTNSATSVAGTSVSPGTATSTASASVSASA